MNQISTQEYHSIPIMKTNENDAQKRNLMNLSKVQNEVKATTKLRVVPINLKHTKIVIVTASDERLINKEYYIEIRQPDLCQENRSIFIWLSGEVTKPIGFFENELQVDGVKLIYNFHAVSGPECDILLGGTAISRCDITVTKEGVKLKKTSQKRKRLRKTTVYYRYIIALRNTDENFKYVANETIKNSIMKITGRSHEENTNSMSMKKLNEREERSKRKMQIMCMREQK